MNLKVYLKELVEEAMDAAVDFGINPTEDNENRYAVSVELLYVAIDKYVPASSMELSMSEGEAKFDKLKPKK